MEQLLLLWNSSGISQITLGQAAMILIGFALLFLAIKKQFEPLLLVPIGFGGILANIPGAGLALTATEQAIAAGDLNFVQNISSLLGLSADADLKDVKEALKDATVTINVIATHYAQELGYNSGMLDKFYQVVIASGVGPLLIFMGVGSMAFSKIICPLSTARNNCGSKRQFQKNSAQSECQLLC